MADLYLVILLSNVITFMVGWAAHDIIILKRVMQACRNIPVDEYEKVRLDLIHEIIKLT
jgi:hypothetical protein